MTEKMNYEVLRKVEDAEIRKYGDLLLATVYDTGDDLSFGMLFDYISGKNEDGKRLPMTAPVVSSVTTSPAEGESPKAGFFTFVLPPGHTVETAPTPSDPRIKIHLQSGRIFAVLRFGGRATEVRLKAMTMVLQGILNKNAISTRGGMFLMRYNSPFAPGFMRRNEVGIEVIGRIPQVMEPNPKNRDYLRTRTTKSGHMLDDSFSGE